MILWFRFSAVTAYPFIIGRLVHDPLVHASASAMLQQGFFRWEGSGMGLPYRHDLIRSPVECPPTVADNTGNPMPFLIVRDARPVVDTSDRLGRNWLCNREIGGCRFRNWRADGRWLRCRRFGCRRFGYRRFGRRRFCYRWLGGRGYRNRRFCRLRNSNLCLRGLRLCGLGLSWIWFWGLCWSRFRRLRRLHRFLRCWLRLSRRHGWRRLRFCRSG